MSNIEKEKFERELINTIRNLMSTHDDFQKSEMAEYAKAEGSISGNLTDPDTNKEYGFKFSIGTPDFFDEVEDDDNFLDEEEYE